MRWENGNEWWGEIWEEVAMVYFQVVSQHLPEDAWKPQKACDSIC